MHPNYFEMLKNLEIVFDREEDGRWIADIERLPGVMAYGHTREDAKLRVQALALRVLGEKMSEETLQEDLVALTTQLFSDANVA